MALRHGSAAYARSLALFRTHTRSTDRQPHLLRRELLSPVFGHVCPRGIKANRSAGDAARCDFPTQKVGAARWSAARKPKTVRKALAEGTELLRAAQFCLAQARIGEDGRDHGGFVGSAFPILPDMVISYAVVSALPPDPVYT